MNQAPIFSVCVANGGVKAVLGSNPTRLYPAGQAPQGVIKPYATWQVISGNPLNYLAGAPDTDDYRLQVDVYANDPDTVNVVANAIMSAIQDQAYVLNYNGDGRDKETGDYYFGFDIGWIVTAAG